MKVFVNRRCEGHYPVGFAAIVIATDEREATDQLNRALSIAGLPETAHHSQFEEVPTEVRCAMILVDGNY
jgi:hypothetical protein